MTLDKGLEALNRIGHTAIHRHEDHLCQGEQPHLLRDCPYPREFRFSRLELSVCVDVLDLEKLILQKLRDRQEKEQSRRDAEGQDA